MLQLVRPEFEWELETSVVGAKKGEWNAVYGSTGGWDFLEKRVHQWAPCWIFQGMGYLHTLKVGDVIPRFMYLSQETAKELEFEKKLKHLKEFTWTANPNNQTIGTLS